MRSMRPLITILLTLLLGQPSLAETVLATYAAEQLKSASEAGTTEVLTINQPGISKARYALRGKVSFEGVSEGYLELLNTFPGPQVYFTRGMATAGPMARLEGTSKGRHFELPFNATAPDGKVLHPERLQLNIVLPQGGKARILSLQLVELNDLP